MTMPPIAIMCATVQVPAARCRCALVLCAVLATHGTSAAEPMLTPGLYDLSVQMLMPHLDEMRRTAVHTQRCLATQAPDALFPVLEQYALGGCSLGYPKLSEQGSEYVLVCASARVASGTAALAASGGGVVGLLTVKMGGKNMTFSERVVAHRLGDCAAAPLQ